MQFFSLFFLPFGKILQVPGLPGTGPGTARQRKQQGREGREGKGRKEGREGKRKGRSGPAARKGAGLRRGWIDGSMDREESKRSSGGREGLGAGKIRSERVAWTAVVAVCFIDRTW